MNWLREHVRGPKDADYARRVLERYRLGMRARGAIKGVRVVTGTDSCPSCQALADTVYHPDDAPILPFSECTHPEGCRCAYSPVMTYEDRG